MLRKSTTLSLLALIFAVAVAAACNPSSAGSAGSRQAFLQGDFALTTDGGVTTSPGKVSSVGKWKRTLEEPSTRSAAGAVGITEGLIGLVAVVDQSGTPVNKALGKVLMTGAGFKATGRYQKSAGVASACAVLPAGSGRVVVTLNPKGGGTVPAGTAVAFAASRVNLAVTGLTTAQFEKACKDIGSLLARTAMARTRIR